MAGPALPSWPPHVQITMASHSCNPKLSINMALSLIPPLAPTHWPTLWPQWLHSQPKLVMNNPHTAQVLSNFRIWQQNAWKSAHNTNYILNATDPSKYDIILIQEPWFNHLGKMQGMHNWRIIYLPTIYHENHNPIWLIILINTNISTNMYTTLDIPSGDIMAISLKGDFSHHSIFNIYNDCMNNNTTTALCDYLSTYGSEVLLSPTDHMLWLGDFNCHHLLWEPNNNRHLYNSADMIIPYLTWSQSTTWYSHYPLTFQHTKLSCPTGHALTMCGVMIIPTTQSPYTTCWVRAITGRHESYWA